ncbi:MAG TPA: DUF2946 family protein [Burkholderiaceae bacterium]
MKTLRIWLLLLLAVLLPVRGALAAAMPCAGEGLHQPAGLVHAGAQLHHHMHAPGDAHAHAAAHAHAHAGVDKCNLCASCCSATPLPATFSLTIAPLEEPSASFPALQASTPTFLSEGQERPPRSV